MAGGATLTWTAKYREAVCGSHPDITSGAAHMGVVGFDTFTGLPEVRLCEKDCTMLQVAWTDTLAR